MNAEERIQMLNQVPPQSNFERKQKIKTAIVLTLATVISILFLVYAFIQKLEADKQRVMAVEAMHEADRQRTLAEQSRLTAAYQQRQAEKQKALAEKALADCENNKK